ncbi:MAG: F0F1 ATP synthase subunit B [Magnetococcales bacterium]|nr:F0F1 ATP synthase subunit B [Magnetococcales bacterium]
MIAIAHAAEGAAAGHASSSGLPQFDVLNFSSQIFWTIVSFAVLLYLLTRFVIPAINAILDARGKSIEDDLSQAKKAREEAEKILANYHKELGAARQEAGKILEQARLEASRLREQVKSELEQESAKKKSAALEEIELAKQRVIEEIKGLAVDLAIDATHKLIGKAVTKTDANKMVEQVMTQLKDDQQRAH